jgi:DNA-directed RNA polymerase specialized sigma24 family protein
VEFDDFYREHRDGLLRLCFLCALDVDVAADSTQEAMLRAFARWDSLAGQEPLAWVRTVALNLCRSQWRRVQRELRLVPRLYSVVAGGEPSDGDLVAEIRRLPRRQREAIVLRYWADLRVEDCATAMAVSVGSVNQHLVRARSALRMSTAVIEREESV